jgi:Ca2+-binding EF-hand superfamily protein
MADIDAILNDDAKLTEITKAVFAEVDKDGSGEIDKAELKVAMATVAREASIEAPSDAQVDEVLKALDTDRSGTVSVEEFKILIKEVLKALKDA